MKQLKKKERIQLLLTISAAGVLVWLEEESHSKSTERGTGETKATEQASRGSFILATRGPSNRIPPPRDFSQLGSFQHLPSSFASPKSRTLLP